MTGNPAAPGSGVNTLTVSQSSGSVPGAAGGAGVTAYADCGGGGPNTAASRTPSQSRAGRGAANRRSPVGGSANGMPRKTPMPAALRRPRTRPLAVRTTGSVTSMYAPLVPRGPRAGPDFARMDPYRRQERRYATGSSSTAGISRGAPASSRPRTVGNLFAKLSLLPTAA